MMCSSTGHCADSALTALGAASVPMTGVSQLDMASLGGAPNTSLLECFPGVSRLTLQTIVDASNITGGVIPALGPVASAALSIMQSIQEAKTNKAEYKELETYVCEITYVTIRGLQLESEKGREQPNNLKKDLSQFLQTLIKIQGHIKRYLKRRWIWRWLFVISDRDGLLLLRRELDHTMNLFGIKSMADLRRSAEQILKNQEEIIKTAPSLQTRRGNMPKVPAQGPIIAKQLQSNNAPSMANFQFGDSSRVTVNNISEDYHVTRNQVARL